MSRTRALTTQAYASPELSPTATAAWKGYIDQWDPLLGVRGWALETAKPELSVKLEFVVGDRVVGVTDTTSARPDVEKMLGSRIKPGFRFDPEVYALLAQLGSEFREQLVEIRIAGTEVRLPPQSAPSVGSLVDSWKSAILRARHRRDEQVSEGDRLLARLSTMRGRAEMFLEVPLRPDAEALVGHFDAFCSASEGQVWFTGWVKRGMRPEFPLIFVDRLKFPAGVALLQYERQDLASNCVGVLGVIDTEWTPPLISKEFFAYAGDKAQFQLKADARTEVMGLDAFLAVWREAAAVVTGGSTAAIRSLISSCAHWIPGNAGAAGIASEAAIDRLLMVPGFGCIADGWAASPLKRIRTFQLKIGDYVLDSEEAATYFSPRPDLTTVLGGRGASLPRAGFVTVFRGAIRSEAAGIPLLRIIHDDGTSVVHRVALEVLQLLDPVSDSEEVMRLYPSLRQEPFYPALLDAIRTRLEQTLREPLVLSMAPAHDVIVVRLPAERNNLVLSFDQVARQIEKAGTGVGFCFITDRTEGFAESKLLFDELRLKSSAPLSLFCVEDPEHGFDELPLILSRMGAERFVYVGRGVVLTNTGWRHVLGNRGPLKHSIEYYEIVDETGSPDRIYGSQSAACFGWSMASLLAWLPGAPRLLRGVGGRNGLPDATWDQMIKGGAIRLERPRTARLADMIDADLNQPDSKDSRGE